MRTFVVAALVTGLSATAVADNALTLPQVLAAAVRQAPDLERATIDVRAAEAGLLRAQGIEDAHVHATLDIVRGRGATIGSLGNEDDKTTTVAVEVTKTLPTGTVFGVRLDGRYQDNVLHTVNQDTGLPLDVLARGYSTDAVIAVTQPLLRNAWSKAFEAPIRDAQHQRDAAVLSRNAKARTLIVQIAEAYWQTALARESWNVRKGSLELAKEQLRFTQEQIKVDKVTKSEEVSVKQVIATREQDVIAAEQQVYDRSLALRELAGLEIGPTDLDVVTDPLTGISDDTLEVPTTVAAALDHSSELAALGETVKAAKAGVDAANGAARPQLDVSIVGGPAGVDDGLGRVIKKTARADGYSVTGNLTFDTALERRTEKGTIAEAHARLQRAQVEERAARARISAQAVRIVQRIKAASISVKLSDETISLALQNIHFEKERFLLGRSTNFDVLRRQDELEGAKLRRVTAIVDYLSARAELDALTGAIFARFGITMK